MKMILKNILNLCFLTVIRIKKQGKIEIFAKVRKSELLRTFLLCIYWASDMDGTVYELNI